MFKKLKKILHIHKFKTLSPRNYSSRGIMCTKGGGGFIYTETGKEIVHICKCGYYKQEKINVITKREGE